MERKDRKLSRSLAAFQLPVSVLVKRGNQFVARLLAARVLLATHRVRQFQFGIFGDGHVEEADHHFLPRLISPANRRGRVRVYEVLVGIVKCRRGLDLQVGSQRERLRELIDMLPIEIVVGDVQQDFFRIFVAVAAAPSDKPERPTTQVHVRR